jgi:hypothetical protein
MSGRSVDIELCHFYLGELLEGPLEVDSEFIQMGIQRAAIYRASGENVTFSILIDDLGEQFTLRQKQEGIEFIQDVLAKSGIGEARIYLESQLELRASALLETLRNNYILTVEGESYLTIVSNDPFLWAQETLEAPKSLKKLFVERLRGDPHAPLRPSQSQFLVPLYTPSISTRSYGCSLLTAVWYLFRLGVEGFELDSGPNDEKARRLVNILPVKYLKSEGFAMDIMRISSAARIRRAAGRIEYILI